MKNAKKEGLRLCKHCKKELSKTAVVCPYCGKKQSSKVKVIGIIIAVIVVLGIGGTVVSQFGKSKSAEPETTSSSKESTTEASNTSYKEILEDYTKKMEKATPTLVEEYNQEAESYIGDTDKLADICNKKVEDLAEICNNGVEEMATLMAENGDKYSKYEKWAKKLQDVYTDYASDIQDAYMDSAT